MLRFNIYVQKAARIARSGGFCVEARVKSQESRLIKTESQIKAPFASAFALNSWFLALESWLLILGS